MNKHYLLNINKYQKIADRWNAENKKNNVIQINNAIEGEIDIDKYKKQQDAIEKMARRIAELNGTDQYCVNNRKR